MTATRVIALLSVAVAANSISFREMTADDLVMMHEWLQRPHVAEWWDGEPTLQDVSDDYMPYIDGAREARPYIALLDDRPLGFIQYYVPAAFHHEGWWLDVTDESVRGIDQFIADERDTNRGLGTLMVRAFVDMIFQDPAVSLIHTDPSPSNARAIRCYGKAGFLAVAEIVTPDGPALLMHCNR